MKSWTARIGLSLAAVAVAGAGCGRSSLSRDEQVRMLMAKDRRLQNELQASQQKVAELTAAGQTPVAPPAAPQDPFRAVAIRFSGFTGVMRGSDKPSEQRLKIVLEPVDAAGDAVKRAGSLDLEALVPGAKGQPPQTYHRWKFPTDEFAQTWLSGLGSYAYVLWLPWPEGRPPGGDTLILRATFTGVGSEVLSAEATIPLKETAPGPSSGAD